MSSRELLDELLGIVVDTNDDGEYVLVSAEFLPERSALNTAMRGGDWSSEEYRQARMINELAGSRADNRDYIPDWVLSPLQIKAEREHEDWQKRRHDENLAQLRGEA